MRRLFAGVAAALGASLLAGCASTPDRAEILVETTPPGADCTLTRGGQVVATVPRTPGLALVGKTPPDDITIVCRRSGFATATAISHAHDVGAGFVGTFEGRSSYAYDDHIKIALVPRPPGGEAGQPR